MLWIKEGLDKLYKSLESFIEECKVVYKDNKIKDKKKRQIFYKLSDYEKEVEQYEMHIEFPILKTNEEKQIHSEIKEYILKIRNTIEEFEKKLDGVEQIIDEEFEAVKSKIEKYLDEHSEDIKKQMKKCFIDYIEDITDDFDFLPEDGYIEYKGWISKDYIFSNIMSRTIPGEYEYIVLNYNDSDRSKEFLKKNIKEAGLELTNEWIEENLYDLFEIWYDFYYNKIKEVEKEIDEEMENTDLPYKVFEDITKNWETCDWYENCPEMFDDSEVYALRRRGYL